MGRIDPLDDDFLTHPALPLSLLVAATAATIAIIISFCAFWRNSEPDLDSSETAENSPDSDVPPEMEQATSTAAAEEEVEVTEALPPPPCMRTLTMTNPSASTDRCNSLMKKSVSARRISSASVKKHFRSISVREIMDKNKHKPDDSLCQKHIILGGKCKVGIQVGADAGAGVDDGKNNTGPETQSSLENQNAIADKDEEEEGS